MGAPKCSHGGFKRGAVARFEVALTGWTSQSYNSHFLIGQMLMTVELKKVLEEKIGAIVDVVA